MPISFIIKLVSVHFSYNKVIALQITCSFFGCSASWFKEQGIYMGPRACFVMMSSEFECRVLNDLRNDLFHV